MCMSRGGPTLMAVVKFLKALAGRVDTHFGQFVPNDLIHLSHGAEKQWKRHAERQPLHDH